MDEFSEDFRAAECERHGPYMSRRVMFPFGTGKALWTLCKECLRQAEEDARAAELRNREVLLRVRLRRMVGHDAVPLRYVGKGFGDYECTNEGQRKALKAVQTFTERLLAGEQPDNLILIGGMGTGKTHLACAAVQALVAQCRPAMHINTSWMFGKIRDSWRPDAEHSTQEVTDALVRLELLVIDEVGGRWGTETEQILLGDMLMQRYERCAPTILIANENIHGVRACIGERAFDRARECARAVIFDWESYRARLADDDRA